MLLPYGSPITLATTGITVSGATALTSLAGLKDGRPGAITRLQWPSGAQTTSTAITIDTTWATPIVPRVAGLVNVRGLPAGLRVRIGWQQTEGGAFDYQQQDSILFDNQAGDRFAWDTWASGLNACYGVRIEVFNDDGDSGTPVTAEAQFDLGEVYAAPGKSLCVLPDPQIDPIEGTVTDLSRSGQPYDAPQPPRRRWRFQTQRETIAPAQTASGSTESVRLALMANPRVLWTFYEGDEALGRQTLVYGLARIGGAQSSPGRRWQSEIQIDELRG